MTRTETGCIHKEWEYNFEGNRWLALTPFTIPAEVSVCWCYSCGELRWREGEGWVPRTWTKREIDELEARAVDLFGDFFKDTL